MPGPKSSNKSLFSKPNLLSRGSEKSDSMKMLGDYTRKEDNASMGSVVGYGSDASLKNNQGGKQTDMFKSANLKNKVIQP